ncbi:branched-chain amino acid ABC transporter, permease protein [Marvinbryantia formatexigens DSM 14469]|uniref:Branched-chain amino acid ABC transporter, permease protein n=1 Tax=Marvinbryantia formatexigens DSM 14469 TaxID=478749 RepID=C6LH95_9FIRM|nr:ABC transporter permease [Marvinbryantia formatexigens]EET59882.1 branched-chain amino acid ABC transporter, permease protein [Marvinbryantia formatexigens DSM 14469]UWO25941.1 ABC transporter permease [Marvinbryantia formatexigens DSM 14469]SDF43900.1 ribose transport system permease protein [Marvinbryantia formatexigens]
MNNKKPRRSVLQAAGSVEPVVWMLAIIVITFAFTGEQFLTWGNAVNIIKQASPFLILALAETMAVLVGQIDLSVGNNMAFCTVIIAMMINAGIPVWLSAIAGILTGACCGLLNGVFIARFKVPAYITTFGFGTMFYGIGSLITGGISVPALNEHFRFLADGSVWKIPMVMILAILVFFMVWILVYRTAFGRNMYGLGGNREALFLGGVNPVKAEIMVFTVAGVLVGIAGVLFAARSASGHPDYGKQWEFNAIAATIIGGNSFSEGNGNIFKTVMGVLFIQILKTGLNISGVSPQSQSFLMGVIVVAAISIDVLLKTRKEA